MTVPHLRIASYNIRKCVGLDRRRDPGRIMRVIAGLGADIVALQEVDRRLGARPATLDPHRLASETGLVPAPVATNAVSLGWHGNAVLLSPDIRIAQTHRVRLPGIEPRGALILEAERGGAPFVFVAAHLGLRRGCRRQQLQEIADRLARLSEPAIIAGDFNEWRPKRGLEPLARAFEVHAPGLSFHARYPVASLDRIALGRGIGLSDAGVADTALTRIASDHLPVWVDLALPQANASGLASRAM